MNFRDNKAYADYQIKEDGTIIVFCECPNMEGVFQGEAPMKAKGDFFSALYFWLDNECYRRNWYLDPAFSSLNERRRGENYDIS